MKVLSVLGVLGVLGVLSVLGVLGVDVYPVVLLHGILSNKNELNDVNNWINENLPNCVYNIEIGNGKKDSIFKPMEWQLDQLCDNIYKIDELKDGFHFIGMSQGGLLARGYVEKCNKYPVINLITWVTPHAGVYGIGNIDIDMKLIYTNFYQNIYSFAGYWKDPYNYDKYLNYASYLPNLNMENIYIKDLINEDYRDNMLKLKNFVMIWSSNDDVLHPPESGKFSFYKILNNNLLNNNSIVDDLPIIDLFETEYFQKDYLGLKTLYETNRLHILETNCTHTGHKTINCFKQLDNLTFPFLN